MTSPTELFKAYDAWTADCLAEWNTAHDEDRHIWTGYEEDPSAAIEFSESGDAHPHGIGGTNHIARAVTPWADSPHFMEI